MTTPPAAARHCPCSGAGGLINALRRHRSKDQRVASSQIERSSARHFVRRSPPRNGRVANGSPLWQGCFPIPRRDLFPKSGSNT